MARVAKKVRRKWAQSAARSRRANRKAYGLMHLAYEQDLALQMDLPMADLQSLAAYIWYKEKPPYPFPAVVAGRGGVNSDGSLYSYQQEDRIVLTRDNRTVLVLLHELAHAMVRHGRDHGVAFRRKFVYLLGEYSTIGKGQADNLHKYVESWFKIYYYTKKES